MNERNAEMQAIKDVVSLYTEGVHTGNIDMLKKAFHPRAMMYGASAKQVTMTEIEGLYQYVAGNEPPVKTDESHECFISAIRYAGNAAIVEVIEESLYGNDYTNFLQLLKIEGKWVIVCKSYNATVSKL
jgi:hypothetical protein